MTATDGNPGDDAFARGLPVRERDNTIGHVDRTCRSAIGGRRAARALAEWAKRFGLTEAEFQLLWRLRSAPPSGLDQTALASASAFSPAQISAIVERLRTQGWARLCSESGDRRRHNWQLSTTGRELLDKMLNAAALLRYLASDETELNSDGQSREAAA